MIDLAQRAYSNKETLQNSFDLALKCKDLKGDFVECGVAAGSQVAAMHRAAPNKKIWCFDSFEGIPLADPKHDTSQPGIGRIKHKEKDLLVSSGITSVSLKQVKHHLKEWQCNLNKFEFVEGWFEETVEKSKVKSISLLRLDGDLYHSTRVCLEYLYPKLVKGGYLIIDDYALAGCYKAFHEYFGDIEVTKVPNTETVIYIQK